MLKTANQSNNPYLRKLLGVGLENEPKATSSASLSTQPITPSAGGFAVSSAPHRRVEIVQPLAPAAAFAMPSGRLVEVVQQLPPVVPPALSSGPSPPASVATCYATLSASTNSSQYSSNDCDKSLLTGAVSGVQQSVAAAENQPVVATEVSSSIAPPSPPPLLEPIDAQQWPSLPSVSRRDSPDQRQLNDAEGSSPNRGSWAKLFHGKNAKAVFKDLRADPSDAGYSPEFMASVPLASIGSQFVIGGRQYFNNLCGLTLCSARSASASASVAAASGSSVHSVATGEPPITLLMADAGNKRIYRLSINGTSSTCANYVYRCM